MLPVLPGIPVLPSNVSPIIHLTYATAYMLMLLSPLSYSLPPPRWPQVHSPRGHLHSFPANRFINSIFLDCMNAKAVQSCPTLWDPMHLCGPPGSSVHAKPSGVPRGPSHLQFPWLLRATMRSPLTSPAQVEGTQGFLPQLGKPSRDLLQHVSRPDSPTMAREQ